MPRCIEIRPNRSLTPRGALCFFAALSATCLAVAYPFARAGFWPVLPFAGAELITLALALVSTQRAARRRELIQIDAQTLVIERQPGRAPERFEFRRPWVRVDLEQGRFRHHPSRLLLRQRGMVCEVGRCLTDRERQLLKARLREILRST